tara:strand:+ start:332 stop:1198 length:867 start_codon:yes stop_codon:yes gene_type:complete
MKDSYANQYYSNGSVTEVAIFGNRAIGAANVLELYNEGKAGDAMTITDASYITGYFRNNGLSTWTDLSTNSNDGTPTSVTETLLCPQGVDGSRCSQGFIMNRARNTSSLNITKASDTVSANRGGAYADIGDADTLDFGTGAFTMEAWVKYDYQNTGSIYNAILCLGGDIAATGGTGLVVKNDGHFYAFIAGSSFKPASDPTLVQGDWYHLVVTRAADNTATWYLNGAADGTSTKSGDVTTASAKKISSDSTNTRYYSEAIDGVKLYNKALDSTEVTKNYKATKGSHRN